MKKPYTKKQITEAIAYWNKQLKKMNESEDTTYDTFAGTITFRNPVDLTSKEADNIAHVITELADEQGVNDNPVFNGNDAAPTEDADTEQKTFDDMHNRFSLEWVAYLEAEFLADGDENVAKSLEFAFEKLQKSRNIEVNSGAETIKFFCTLDK